MKKIIKSVLFFVGCCLIGLLIGRGIGQCINGFTDFLPAYTLEQIDNKVVPKYIDTYFLNDKNLNVSKKFTLTSLKETPKEIDFTLTNYNGDNYKNSSYVSLEFHKCFFSNKYKLIYTYVSEKKNSMEYTTFGYGYYKRKSITCK